MFRLLIASKVFLPFLYYCLWKLWDEYVMWRASFPNFFFVYSHAYECVRRPMVCGETRKPHFPAGGTSPRPLHCCYWTTPLHSVRYIWYVVIGKCYNTVTAYLFVCLYTACLFVSYCLIRILFVLVIHMFYMYFVAIRENVRRMKNSDHVKGIVMFYNISGSIPPGQW